jgi:acetoin utilization deacetylase AcuC-like enzyme
MQIFYSDLFQLPLPEGHRFPLEKYRLLRERVQSSRLVPPDSLSIPPPATREQLLRVHTPDYVDRVLLGQLDPREIRRIGFPWSPGLVERSLRSVGGAVAACRRALNDGWAANLAGGTHHAYPDHGEGFCVFNDVAVAARAMQAEGRLERAVILDCDVHQGNGTAAIFAGDPSVYTFSIHGAKNFPFHKEQSRLDIALPDGAGDDEFLTALSTGARQAVEEANAGLAIYIAGSDPYHGDRLGRMALTKAGLLERDRIIFDLCEAAGLPVAIVLGGGYAREITDSVDIHFATLRLALERSGVSSHTPAP